MANFSTKKYTRPVLAKELRKLGVNNFSSFNTLATALSPRVGLRSAKVAALKSVVGVSNLRDVFKYAEGSDAKSILISLVRNA